MITIIQFIYSFQLGGSEIYATNISKQIDQSKFKIIVFAMDKGGLLENDLKTYGITSLVVHRPNRFSPALFIKIYRLYQRYHPKVIHTHHFTQLLYGAPAAKLLGARVIHTEHSIEQFKRPRIRFAMKCLSYLCHKVTIIGEEGAQYLIHKVGIPASKVEVIPTGVDTTLCTESRDSIRGELHLSLEDRVAIIVARLSPEKNHLFLLETFRKVLNRMPIAKLLIVGEGTEEANIRRLIETLGIEKHVRLLGARRDIPRLLSACDLFTLSSTREGLPIAILEAMAAGLPVVSTDVGDVRMAVKDGVNGILVPSGDSERYADAVLELLTDSDKRNEYGRKGRELVLQNYSLEAMVKRYDELYAE
jgi:glycosyltransferase involved in cell wall biosynthesis